MGHCVAYTAGAITFMGIGALITGVTLYFVYPNMMDEAALTDNMPRYAMCQLQSPDGAASPSGSIFFNQTNVEEDVFIYGKVSGLTEGPHGFHIHQYGVTGLDCKSTGGHFNPENHPHGGPENEFRHVGDLGNIQSLAVGEQLEADVEISDSKVSLYGDFSVLGRAVVIHAGEDDLGESGDSAGAAGARVACCTIYMVSGEL